MSIHNRNKRKKLNRRKSSLFLSGFGMSLAERFGYPDLSKSCVSDPIPGLDGCFSVGYRTDTFKLKGWLK